MYNFTVYVLCYIYLDIENHVQYSIRAAMNSIQNRTCIKFKKTQLAPANNFAVQKFALVFSKRGNRYLLYIFKYLYYVNVSVCMIVYALWEI